MDRARVFGALKVFEQQVHSTRTTAREFCGGSGIVNQRLVVDLIGARNSDVVATAIDRVTGLNDNGAAIEPNSEPPHNSLAHRAILQLLLDPHVALVG